MAKIYIKAIQNPYNVSEKDATEIDLLWRDESISSSRKFHMGVLSFEKGQIKLIELERSIGDSDNKRLNPYDFEQRKVIDDFEMELNGRDFFRYMHNQKIILCKDEKCIVWSVCLPDMFTDYFRKWNGLQYARSLREKAERKNLDELGKQELVEKLSFSDEINVSEIPF